MATAHFRQTLEIRAAPAAVHALLADLDQLRVLHPLIESIRELPPRTEQPDARRYRVVDRLEVGRLRVRSAYTAELRTLSESEIEGRAWQRPGIELKTIYRMEASTLGTQLTESTELRAPWPLRGFVLRQAEAAHRDMLEHLKAHLETTQTETASGCTRRSLSPASQRPIGLCSRRPRLGRTTGLRCPHGTPSQGCGVRASGCA